jgi:hypothetical protein
VFVFCLAKLSHFFVLQIVVFFISLLFFFGS